MNIYDLLKSEHREFEDWAERITETEGASETREKLWATFKTELEAHAAAEEQTLYAKLFGHAKTQEKARHSAAEHKTAADLVEELDDTDMSTGAWLQKFKKLKEAVEHHIKEEENEVFPQAREVLDGAEEAKLIDEYRHRKRAEK